MSTKQLWDNALEHLRDLTGATLYREAELEARVAELESELAALKLAYNTTADIDTKSVHNAPLQSISRQTSAFNITQQDPLVLCAIDGDRLLFHPSLIEQGYQGGRQAAQDFTKAVAQELLRQDLTGFERLSFWVTIFLNKRAVINASHDEGIAQQVEPFLLGFGQASPRFLIVDVGSGRDNTEMKVKEYIKTYIRFPQTLRLFFGGVDEAYLAMYDGLEKEDLASKLVLLQPPTELSPGMRRMSARSLRFDGLFMTERASPWMSRRPGPLLGITDNSSGVVTNGGLISPQSESQTSMTTPPPQTQTFGGPRTIDPTKPLHKQNPPPCNEHYLMTCSKGQNCKYSHDWLLTAEQLDILRRNAKKAPCNYLKNGLPCPHGDRCCWGHICPSGARCFHLSKGKCWFKGDGMHPPVSFQQPMELLAG